MTVSSYIDVSSFDALGAHGLDKVVVAVGVFDGIHLGHLKLLEELLKMARSKKAQPVAITFHPHPRELLNPDSPPSLLLPPEVKTRLLHQYGAKGVVTIPFTREFAALSPPEFVYDCLSSSRVEMKGICVGSNWRFGSGGTGDVNFLRERAGIGHFAFKSVDEVSLEDGRPVSSTAIRRAISSGNLPLAKTMLGRNYSLYGTVEAGRHIAGPELKHPTANLKIRYGVLPPNGVYAGKAKFEGSELPAAIAIGTSPTFMRSFGGDETRVEVHILGFEGDIYGKPLEAELVSYIREERCFPDVNSLKSQIDEDVQAVLASLKGLRK